jgi:hypothetical protein
MELVPHLPAPTGKQQVVEPEALEVVLLTSIRISQPPTRRPFPSEMCLGSRHSPTPSPSEVFVTYITP